MKINARKAAVIPAIIGLGILVRAYVVFVIKPISGDTAVFALMAKHIFELKEFYIYMPMAHYAGAFYSYLSAALFALLGVSYSSFMIVGILSSCAGLIIGCVISNKILNSSGVIISDILIALPAFGMIYYSLYIGVNAENFLFIPLLLLMAIKINRREYANRAVFMAATGLISGLALWLTPAVIPVVLTIMTLFVIGNRGRLLTGAIALFLAGILIGYLPAVIYDFLHPGAAFFRMAGRVLDLNRSALLSPDPFGMICGKIFWRFSTIPGSLARIPRFTSELISLPLTILLFVSIAVSFKGAARRFIKNKYVDDIGVIAIYVLWFIIFYTMLVGEGAGRFMAPLAIVAPFLIGDTLSRIKKFKARHLLLTLMIAALIFCNMGTITRASSVFAAARYTKLTDWLIMNNVTRGYSDYDTAYIVQFESKEKVLVSPTLFDPTFCDRWPENTKMIRGADDVCYIIDGRQYPHIIEPFEKNLSGFGQRYRKDIIGDFTVYRKISHTLEPKDVMSGITAQGKR
ncbi:MAG: hypothetical protein KJ661_00055 [Candidatus Omnitrophica bacterium]|nr:hypothetical protein [Candidatus Omnitrophota bacterium]